MMPAVSTTTPDWSSVMSGDEIRRQALARDIARRLQLAGQDELRAVDRVFLTFEIIREGAGDRRWQRRLPTGPGDRDRSFHLVIGRPWVVETLCNGSWRFADRSEQRTNPPLAERCRACWLRAVDGDWLAVQLIALANELEDEDRERAELREQARAEMLEPGPGEQACSRCGVILLFSARRRGDGRCGTCSREASIRVVVDDCEAPDELGGGG